MRGTAEYIDRFPSAQIRNNIKELLFERDIPDVNFAKRLGISYKDFLEISEGNLEPDFRLALEMANVLQVEVNELFYLEAEDSFEEYLPLNIISASSITDKGEYREENQDAFVLERNHKKELLLALVADGVGSFSESAAAARLLCSSVRSHLYQLYDTEGDFSSVTIGKLRDGYLNLIQDVHSDMAELSLENDFRMGTTATLLVIYKDRYFCIQVGDSRLYIDQDGSIKQITEDQTLGQRLRSKNIKNITPKQDHTLLQCVGVGEVLPRVYEGYVSQDMTFLVCSDGLYNTPSLDELHEVLAGEETARIKIRKLKNMARENGETDNITGIIARVTRG